MIENSTVLITGGAGFIGSNLCERLLEQDNKVICLDNLSTGHERNVKHFFSRNDFEFINGDICDAEICRKATRGVDIILHQAALGSVPRSVEFPLATHEANSTGTLNVLDAARINGVKRFVYASSSSVYGNAPDLPKKEERTGLPLSPYAASKAVGEMYAKVYGQLYGMETIGLRYFNVFGKNQDPNGAYAAVIPKFIKALINGAPVTIHGDGEQSRDFTYIENVIQANQLAATTENPDAFNTAYNVAYGEQYTINYLVGQLELSLKKFNPTLDNVNIQFIDERPGDIKHSLADTSKARKLLGYSPSFSLKEGLDKAMKWYWDYFKGQLTNS
ncbi:MAG: SDR family oxidoreductase [Flavobacteriales bacterium]|nr:SDR family oxidoreductase [Flavobacteriales bacterium]